MSSSTPGFFEQLRGIDTGLRAPRTGRIVGRAMRVKPAGCDLDDLDVVVTIEVGVGRWGAARAAARAGPV
jgi:hypothetical protein